MTTKRLIIHSGPPKTGSTAIQSFMRAASESGNLRNVQYPLIDKKIAVDSIESGNGSSISHYLRREDGVNRPKAELETKVLRVLSGCRNSDLPIVLSSEGFWGLDTFSAPMFVEVLEDLGFAPEILFVVRPFQDVWQSQISQSIRGGEFEDLISVNGADRYVERIQLWSGLEMPMQAISYDSKNVIINFLEFLGESHLKDFDFGFERVNQKLSGPEARILRKSVDVTSEKKWSTQIANNLRRFYEEIDLETREALELEVREFSTSSLEIPDSMQPMHGYEHLKVARKQHESLLNKDFWDLLMIGSDAPKTYTFENTPALAALNPLPILSEIENVLLHKSVVSALVDTAQHASNLEAMLATGSPFSQLILANDGKLEFNDSSHLGRSRLGFDPVHYLILNPDVDRAGVDPHEHFKLFGKSEGRYTKISKRTASQSVLLNGRPLFLVHSPRTGGTALREMLTDEFGEDRVTRSHQNVAVEKKDSYKNFEFLLGEKGVQAASKNAVLVGHFPAQVKDELGFEHFSAIFMRDPIARSISMLRKESKDQGLSIEELISDSYFMDEYIKDAQCRILIAPASLEAGSGIFNVNESMLEWAKSKLREFDFIGLYENYEESIRHFDSTFKTSLLSRMNKVNESLDVDVPNGIAEVLAPLVAMDLKLYEYAVELFQARISNTDMQVH
jgi:hypothetical protein